MLVFEDLSEVETAEAMRRDFVANVSHELRTPLTALMGFIETLRGAARDDPAARERFLSIMEREALRMNRLVGDLLSLSRVEAEERRRPEHPVDLALVVQSVMQSLRPQAEAAKVVLERTGEAGPLKLPADPDQITQVLTNLVENAMKYFINTQLLSKEEDIDIFYFSSFDESWKVGPEGEVGAHWGIWDKNEQLKF